MNKKEFQKNFRALIDNLIEDMPVFNELANKFSKKKETIEKWYDGVSVPANATREAIISHLYKEQKRKEAMDIVRDVIKNELTIEVRQDPYVPVYEGDSPSLEIFLKLGGEVIHTEYITLQW